MAFTKIRQTVAAFRRPADPSYADKIRARHSWQQHHTTKSMESKPNFAVRLAVLLGIVLPVSYLLSVALQRAFSFDAMMTGMITSAVLTFIIGNIHGAVMRRIEQIIPSHELNAFFGSKLEETAAAFRRSPKKDPNQRQLL